MGQRVRAVIGGALRRWADRVDDANSFRGMSYSFTFERHRGMVINDDSRGCPLWVCAADYDRAHDEAEAPL